MNKDIIEILKKNNIEVIEEPNFNNETEKILFLNKIEKIIQKEIKIHCLNQDIKDIIIELDLNEENLLKLQKINFEDFKEIILKTTENERQIRIYKNFLKFIRTELNLEICEKKLTDKSLFETEKKDKGQKEDKEEKKNDENCFTDISIYEKKQKFDINADTEEKAKKFNVDLISDYRQMGKKNTVNDFILYFNKRLQYFTKLLENRINADNVMRISALKDKWESNIVVTVIGLVSEITETKNGHMMITIEDRGGQVKCFINKKKIDPKSDVFDKDFKEKIDNLCLDEGIGIVGKVGKELIWTDEILIPSPPNNNSLKKTEEGGYVVCISDLHIGSKVFVEEAFYKFTDWLNGKTNNDMLNRVAKQVKYVVIAGDIIEGIGIYPDQGKDVRIMSTESQYNEAASILSLIPKDKCIIMIPGNHDTNRLSEPQTKLPYEKAYALYNMENTLMLSNPSIVNLFGNDTSGGLNFFLYHGGSIFYYADKIQHLREKGGAKAPEEVIKYLLEKRHLAPSHGSTLYIPDSQNDPLVIKKMPDFFVTGHTHKMSVANYKGCTILSCGCWTEMSDYQEKMGMFPDIGKCILINTHTRKPQIINFYKEKEEE